VSLTKIGLYF